jgi:hypothetical protein
VSAGSSYVEDMRNRSKYVIGAAVIAASAAIPTIAVAGGSGDDGEPGDDAREVEVPISGTDLEKASAAALAYTGEGQVTGTEVGDEESYYEIEVTLDDGRQVDVQLDKTFAVVGTEDEGFGLDD